MNSNKIIGFGLGLVGSILAWQTGIALAQYFHENGTDQLLKLLLDPEHSLRLMCAMSAFLAGLAALTERNGGAWLAGFSSALLFIQTMSLVAGHGSIHTWESEAVFLIILTGLFLAMVVAGRRTDAQAAKQVAARLRPATA